MGVPSSRCLMFGTWLVPVSLLDRRPTRDKSREDEWMSDVLDGCFCLIRTAFVAAVCCCKLFPYVPYQSTSVRVSSPGPGCFKVLREMVPGYVQGWVPAGE